VSLAGLALKHGVNANLLRKWVVRHQHAGKTTPIVTAPTEAFVPIIEVAHVEAPTDEPRRLIPPAVQPAVQPAPVARPVPARLKAHLPNGVVFELACGEQDAALVSAVIDSLGRCDVPPGR
jgi:transposase